MSRVRVQKDIGAKALSVLAAWESMRSHKKFFGLTVEEFRWRTKPYLEARDEIASFEAQAAHAVSKRDAAGVVLSEVVQGVVSSVKGDPEEGANGELYAAMGYIPKNQRASGLFRRRKAKAAQPEGGSN